MQLEAFSADTNRKVTGLVQSFDVYNTATQPHHTTSHHTIDTASDMTVERICDE